MYCFESLLSRISPTDESQTPYDWEVAFGKYHIEAESREDLALLLKLFCDSDINT